MDCARADVVLALLVVSGHFYLNGIFKITRPNISIMITKTTTKIMIVVFPMADSAYKLRPHLGQVRAVDETSVPQSEHFSSAICVSP